MKGCGWKVRWRFEGFRLKLCLLFKVQNAVGYSLVCQRRFLRYIAPFGEIAWTWKIVGVCPSCRPFQPRGLVWTSMIFFGP